MPRRLDQLPADASSLARKIADLERQVKELRAAKRAAHTTVASGNLVITSENGWQIILDPGSDFPVIYFRSPDGSEMAALNATGLPDRPGYDLSSGPFPDGDIDDYRWVTFAGRLDDGSNAFLVERSRESDVDGAQTGGYTFLGADIAQLAVVDVPNSNNQIIQIDRATSSVVLDQIRAFISPPASGAPGLTVSTSAGHTGTLLSLIHDTIVIFTVATNGNTTIAGQLTAQTLNIGTGTSTIGGDLSVTGTHSIGTDLKVASVSQGRGAVAFQARSTATTASTTEQIALTQTGVALKTGRAYRVKVRGLCQNNTASTGVRIRVRKTNVTGAIWADTFTVATPTAATNCQYANEQVIANTTGATITTDLVMTWLSVTAGSSFLNAGPGFYTAFDVTDIGAAADFPTAQAVT